MWETPDMFIAPSTWHYDDVDAFCKERNLKHVYLHLPIDRSEIPRRHIDSARTFIHIAGRPAVHDRNGTYTFLNAIQLSEGALKGIVYTQNRELADDIKRDFPMVKVVVNLHNYAEMYKKGAVLVLPRKYGGNCLPLNEALAAGMPVIMSRLSPQTDFLPAQWLVAANKTDIDFVPRTKIDVYKVSPYELMIKMLWFKSLSNQDMKEQSNKADEIADTISWETMAPKYLEVLEALCHL
jgi:glycosyltransferase involved in cell wall biosynthesis